ncbi:MAG: HDOD domain-containing protein [Candidatus Riflebacteria bacterium]|nr:HDOD domain-containing protein [Candidatus Riflebacteria bacterium]
MKASILFVDDEPNVIQGLQRMLRDYRDEWDMYFAGSGEEALKLMQQKSIDVIVSDLRMPEMNGSQLLEKVQIHYPHTVRIVLSGESDSEYILPSARCAHQFFAKPCDPKVLKKALTRSIELRNLLKNPAFLKVISGIPFMPSIPRVYNELLSALESEDSSAKAIGDIIAKDVTMTARVLQLVNSAFFGLPRRVTTPQEAVLLLGVNIIKSLVLYVKLFFTAPDVPIPGMSLDDLWEHSSKVGALAKSIIYEHGGDKTMMENAVIAGMMHDAGKLLLMDISSYMTKVRISMREGKTFSQAEYEEFSTSHAEIGAYLLGIWGLPEEIVETVALHHKPTMLPSSGFSLLTAVHVADAYLIAAGKSKPLYDEEYLKTIGVMKDIPAWEKLAEKLE